MQRFQLAITAVWAMGTLAIVGAWPMPPQDPVVVTHWANVYLMERNVLPAMAATFNGSGRRTRSGRPIEVQPYLVNSGRMYSELVSLGRTGQPSGVCNSAPGGCPDRLPDPAVITPAADHWLGQINFAVGRPLVDDANARTLGTTFVGIVMPREMARCLGWPEREIGLADIVALRQSPDGWGSLPCAKAEWGRVPLTVFTDPNSSSNAQGALYALYSIGAGRPVGELRVEDVTNPAVVAYVTAFQGAVDRYVPDTVTATQKFLSDLRYGHFFFLPENAVFFLCRGSTAVDTAAPPILPAPDVVMVYPREGSPALRQPAAAVHGSWVSDEQREATDQWIRYLIDLPQQQVFGRHGVRPASAVPFSDSINPRCGLDPSKPARILNPEPIDPAVAQAIHASWGDVKNSGVLTLVVDASGAAPGSGLAELRAGLVRALDAINRRNLVGLVASAGPDTRQVTIEPVTANKFRVLDTFDGLRPSAESALYTAIQEAIAMTDEAPGDTSAIRGVAILATGQPTTGRRLDELVRMMTRDGTVVRECRGFAGDASCVDATERSVALSDVIGTALVGATTHPLKVCAITIGNRANGEIGRILAEATGADCAGTTVADLSRVLAQYGDYF